MAVASVTFVSASVAKTDIGILAFQPEALTACEASVNCPDGTTAKCNMKGEDTVCGSGERNGKKGTICINSSGVKDEDFCD